MYINNEVTAQHFLEFDAKFVWIIVKKDFLEKIKIRVPILEIDLLDSVIETFLDFYSRKHSIILEFSFLLVQVFSVLVVIDIVLVFIVVICWEISHHFIELPNCKFVPL